MGREGREGRKAREGEGGIDLQLPKDWTMKHQKHQKHQKKKKKKKKKESEILRDLIAARSGSRIVANLIRVRKETKHCISIVSISDLGSEPKPKSKSKSKSKSKKNKTTGKINQRPGQSNETKTKIKTNHNRSDRSRIDRTSRTRSYLGTDGGGAVRFPRIDAVAQG